MVNGSDDFQQRLRRRRRVTAAATTFAGLAVLLGAAWLILSWRPDLPDPVASHWGARGAADGFSSLDSVVAVMLGGGSVLVLGFGAITWWLGQTALMRRIAAASAVWSALFVAIVTAGSLNGQRGLTDARAAADIGGVLLLAFAVSLVSALVVGLVVPADPPMPTTQLADADAPRAALAAGTDPVWVGAAQSRAIMLIALVPVVLVFAVVVLTQLWVLLFVAGLLVVLIATMSSAVVSVNGAGVTIRSPVGWPRTRIPLTEIVRADVTRVRPMRDFGGWGWRVGRRGRVGIVLRSGEALLVERTGDRSIVVTVDGAAAAAGMVNTLTDRARSRRS